MYLSSMCHTLQNVLCALHIINWEEKIFSLLYDTSDLSQL